MIHIFEPGNGTKYTITAIKAPSKPNYNMFMLDYWQTFMYVRDGDVPHWTYIKEKLNVSQGDAIALQDFFRGFWDGKQ
jgi:hypothetical protein